MITVHIPRRATGSMPADGSSRKTIGGSPIVAMATESFLGCGQMGSTQTGPLQK